MFKVEDRKRYKRNDVKKSDDPKREMRVKMRLGKKREEYFYECVQEEVFKRVSDEKFI